MLHHTVIQHTRSATPQSPTFAGAMESSPHASVDVEISSAASFQSNSAFSTPTRRLPGVGPKMLSHNGTRQLSSPGAPSSASVTSSAYQRHRFDERIRSRFTAMTKELASSKRPYTAPDTDTDTADVKVTRLKWLPFNTINTLLYGSNSSRSIHGVPTCLSAGDVLAIGTSKGYVLIFDYRQILQLELGKGTPALQCGAVSSIALSLDSTHVCVGYESGDVFIWELKQNLTKPKVHVAPLEANDITVTDSHAKGSPINNVSFVGKRHTVVVSSDIYGLVMYHQAHRGVLGFSVTTRRVLGKYEEYATPTGNTVFGLEALPLGTSVQHMDSQGLVAIITSTALVVVTTSNVIRTQFKTGRPKVVNDTLGKTGCLAWFPAVVLKDGTREPAKLAYCFGDVFTVIEVSSMNETLHFDTKKRWVCDEAITALRWVNPSVLAMVTKTQQLVLLNYDKMTVATTIDILSKHIHQRDLFAKTESHRELTDNLNHSFQVYRGKLFIVGRYEIFIGSIPKWVDLLLDLINEGRYIKAIETARKYYTGEADDFALIGLPRSTKDRHKIVLKYLVDMIQASVTHVLQPVLIQKHGAEIIQEFLHSAIQALISINAESVVFEELYEAFKENGHVDFFFEALEPFILSNAVKTLTPVILKDMVAHYIAINQVETLEQNICLLDIQSLDIDFTLNLLKKFNLNDPYIYIWNSLLHDYITPFLDFIQDIKLESNSTSSPFQDTSVSNGPKLYAYLAYILTGRQYPTENFIPEPEATDAKLSLYFALFNGSPIIYENGAISADDSSELETAFPYLTLLAQYSSRQLLSCMNECLEDSLLNDDEIVHRDDKLKVNRQFIFEILIEVFENQAMTDLDHLNLAMFIARNYPKFHQFIRLNERTLDRTLRILCEYQGDDDDTREDCELSLQSLLSVYQPSNRAELLDVFEKAGFNEILLNLYLNDGKYSKVLDVWLRSDKTNSVDTTDGVLEKCYRSTEKGSKERKDLDGVVQSHFADLVEVDTYKIALILNKYAPSMHKLSLELEDAHLKHLYLSSLVKLESDGLYSLSVTERTHYIKNMCVFEKESLLDYVKSLSKADVDLNDCVDDLRANGCIDVLVFLLVKDGKYKESLDEVLNYMLTILNKLPVIVHRGDRDELALLEAELWKQLQTAIALANHDGPQTQTTTSDDLSLNEGMWLTLIKFVVDQLKKLDVPNSSTKSLDIVKRLLQDLFSTLINTRSQISSLEINEKGISTHQSSFLKIFMEFLSSSSVHVTVLGDVRFVTNEIYLALSYEKSTLTITAKLINESIYQNLEKLSEKNLSGWSVLNFECDACGRIIWGHNLDSGAYVAWEDKTRQLKTASSKFESMDLVTFNCRHCYHKSCLENLGSRDGFSCIICDDKKDIGREIE
ncbi:Vacuolar protein sorting-associated protein 8 [Cyberlindnera fabianii]|uniref:Vacuolar protein sorting-associated protein 8 n=1 Tax=Cyberlindnera fabianii TaxID=36022 RepID=A0A1V2L7T8_CYBFA|nr:Vacuolar protein sorting-associated protein 8 [Cyberlindnera fabianii]